MMLRRYHDAANTDEPVKEEKPAPVPVAAAPKTKGKKKNVK